MFLGVFFSDNVTAELELEVLHQMNSHALAALSTTYHPPYQRRPAAGSMANQTAHMYHPETYHQRVLYEIGLVFVLMRLLLDSGSCH